MGCNLLNTGGGLLQARGERWFRNRKLMTPAFHFGVLRSYVKIYNECADTFLVSETNCESLAIGTSACDVTMAKRS